MRLAVLVPASLALLALAACARPTVVPLEGDTFMVAERVAQLGSGPPVRAKADVYEVANAFCAQRGKQLETVSLDMTDSGLTSLASVSLVFRCVDPPKPGPAGGQRAPTRQDTEKQLEALKALQAKGLITQEDFDRKKKEILDRM